MDTVAFLMKKLVSAFCYPVGLVLVLLIVGQVFLFSKKRLLAAKGMIAFATLLLLVGSFPITAFLVMNHLEARAGGYADPVKLKREGVRFIVVLAGALVTDTLTPADRWGNSILRVMEGVRLSLQIPDSRLVLSGGSYPGKSSQAAAMEVLPISLGIRRSALILETRAWDTDDEARIFTELVGKKPFALVTSAAHMPRAMGLFRSKGAHPIACPCDFRALDVPPMQSWFLPSANALQETQSAAHEYLGMLWQSIRGGRQITG